jgi:excisionase family DNA binding protein
MNSHVSTLEAAQMLECSSENVRLLARSGRLPTAIRTRAGRLFLRTDVEQLAARRTQERKCRSLGWG